MAKVQTLQKSKKELVKDAYERKGISELLAEVKVPMDDSKSRSKLVSSLITKVKAKFKKDFEALPREEKMTYFTQITQFPVQQVTLSEYVPFEKGKHEYFTRLLKGTLVKPVSNPDIVQVTIKSGEDERIGYSVLNGDIEKKRHRGSWCFKRDEDKHGSFFLIDIPTLIAETIVAQSVASFYEKQRPDVIKELFVEYYLEKYSSFSLPVPKSEAFKHEFKAIARKKGATLVVTSESSSVEGYRHIFMKKPILKIGSIWGIDNDQYLLVMIREFLTQSRYAINQAARIYDERGDSARAYETKQHINPSQLKRMNDNAFLDVFNFVELDNDVDLKLFSDAEENFVELQKLVTLPSGGEFRVKKLGRHRVNGAFYPTINNLLLSLKEPSAFMHEAFHAMDNQLGKKRGDMWYSEGLEFRTIITAYKERVEKAVNKLPESNEFRKQWNGKSKFSKSYYFDPCEIFARSGEVWMTTLDLPENSLFRTKEELFDKEHEGAIFPFDEEYLALIKPFFEDVFRQVKEIEDAKPKRKKREKKKEEEKPKPKTKSKPKAKTETKTKTTAEQKKRKTTRVASKPVADKQIADDEGAPNTPFVEKQLTFSLF